MSKASDFHPSLSTLEIAKFQLLEQGFAGVTNGVTLVPARRAPDPDTQALFNGVAELLHRSGEEEYVDTGDALNLLNECYTHLATLLEKKEVAVLVIFRPSVREGEANVQPIARMIDPWEVIEPEFAHTDGAGNVKEDGGNDNNSTDPRRNNGDGSAG